MVQCLVMYVTEVGRENREIKWKSQKRKRFDRSSRVSRIFWIVSLLISWFDVTLDGCRSQGSPQSKVAFGVNTNNVVEIFYLLGEKMWLTMPPTPSKPPKHPLACFCKDFWKGWTKTISLVVLKRWEKCHGCLSGISKSKHIHPHSSHNQQISHDDVSALKFFPRMTRWSWIASWVGVQWNVLWWVPSSKFIAQIHDESSVFVALVEIRGGVTHITHICWLARVLMLWYIILVTWRTNRTKIGTRWGWPVSETDLVHDSWVQRTKVETGLVLNWI